MEVQKVVYRLHARQRMFGREIVDTDVTHVLRNGECVEDYAEDTPYPSKLLLGFSNGQPLHVVVAINSVEQEAIVITVYRPEPTKWSSDFKTRVKQ